MKNIIKKACTSLAAAAFVLSINAAAEDIELFLVETSTIGGDGAGVPNVLIVIDNSANWGATLGPDPEEEGKNLNQETMERRALTGLLVNSDALDGKMRIGLMSFTHGNSPRGGKVLAPVRDLNEDAKSKFGFILNKANEGKAGALAGTNNAPLAMMLHEAYRYFGGHAPWSGTQDTVGGQPDYAVAAIGTDGNYISPALDGECSKNAILLVTNGGPDSGENNSAEARLRALGGVMPDDPITLARAYNSYESNWSDEFARFLATTNVTPGVDGDRSIITYVLDVYPPLAEGETEDKQSRPWRGARGIMRSIAYQGNGRYYAVTSAEEFMAAFEGVIEEIQAVNSVFAATSLPVSVNVRGTNLNQVYMGVFRPDAHKKPRWHGNLKLYKLGLDAGTDQLYLADATGRRADSATTGFIHPDAISYWSESSAFWTFGGYKNPSDVPDGDLVEKGGVAQKLRQQFVPAASEPLGTVHNRRLLTCNSSASCTGLANFTSTLSGLSASLVRWLAGEDNLEDENSDGEKSDVRASIHGDVLHSRPAVVNYSENDDDIVVYYGANDGVFRAVRGGFGSDGGTELWGFVAPEHYGKLERLRTNEADPDSPTGGKPYFFDGGVGVYSADGNTWIYPVMRRGGRSLYAFDVSTATAPTLKWRKTPTDTGFGELGQTWSEPRAVRIAAHTGPVLIFGAGYDPAAEDADPRGMASMGRGIMVVDAADGTLLWQVGKNPSGALYNVTREDMIYSIPSDVTVIDRNRDGNVDRIYVGDTGGNVWRVDIAGAMADWQAHKLAELGPGRKFLYPPDVVYDDGYDAILIGSGDREKPFQTSVQDRYFMLKDKVSETAPQAIHTSVHTITTADAAGENGLNGDLLDVTGNEIQDGTAAEQLAAATALELAENWGWYIDLRPGEKVIGGSMTLGGTTFFSTNQPAVPEGCDPNLGIARNYAVSFRDARATQEQDGVAGLTGEDRHAVMPGGGFIPSPVPVIVQLETGEIRAAVLRGPHLSEPPENRLTIRRRTFWNKNID
jgi:type IV pilus assembly protein PilY1